MTEIRRGLGRGLSALLGEGAAEAGPARGPGVSELDVDLLRPNPNQPRRTFTEAELDELAQSIAKQGLLQPILARPSEGEGGFEIVAGERRWRAAQKAGRHTVPVIVRVMDDLEAMQAALVENLQRADLNPMEEARGYAFVMKRSSFSQEAVAELVGKSRPHVANALRLLRLPAAIQEHLEAGRLTAGHARALIDRDDKEALAERIIKEGLSVRQAEALARRPPAPEEKARLRRADADTRDLERSLSEVLGLQAAIRDRGGKGELTLQYSSLEQLDDLCRRLMRPG